MINTGEIEAGHNLSTEEYEMLHVDKVFYKKKSVFRYMSIQSHKVRIDDYIF